MSDPGLSIKMKMLEDAGFPMDIVQERYVLLVDFIKSITKLSCCNVCKCISYDCLELLRKIGESE